MCPQSPQTESYRLRTIEYAKAVVKALKGVSNGPNSKKITQKIVVKLHMKHFPEEHAKHTKEGAKKK